MGVATVGIGDASPRFEILVDVPQKSRCLKRNFLNICQIFRFINISKIKWPKSEEKSDLGVGGFDSPEFIPPSESVPPQPAETSWRRPCSIPFTVNKSPFTSTIPFTDNKNQSKRGSWNTILFKNRSEDVPLMTSYLRDLTWPDQFLPKAAIRMPHRLHKASARFARRFGLYFRKKNSRGHPPHWRGLRMSWMSWMQFLAFMLDTRLHF